MAKKGVSLDVFENSNLGNYSQKVHCSIDILPIILLVKSIFENNDVLFIINIRQKNNLKKNAYFHFTENKHFINKQATFYF